MNEPRPFEDCLLELCSAVIMQAIMQAKKRNHKSKHKSVVYCERNRKDALTFLFEEDYLERFLEVWGYNPDIAGYYRRLACKVIDANITLSKQHRVDKGIKQIREMMEDGMLC